MNAISLKPKYHWHKKKKKNYPSLKNDSCNTMLKACYVKTSLGTESKIDWK